jgi:general secretion pathway protein D
MRPDRFFIALSCLALSAGCATPINYQGPEWMGLETSAAPVDDTEIDRTEPSSPPSINQARDPEFERRTVPSIAERRGDGVIDIADEPNLPDAPINATLPPQPVPAFINTVFGEILEQPFTLGPNVSTREELISLRSVRDLSPATFLALVEEALKDYGLGVSYDDGLFRIIELAELRAQTPRFITARAHAAVPTGLRPVVQFVQLTAIDVADMQPILEQAFPDRSVLTVRSNRQTNAMVLSGLADDVNAATAIIDEMDELRFAGTQMITVSPRNWEASELANAMLEVLTVEGYIVAVGSRTPRPITLLPLDFTNQVMIFASNRQLANYALALAARLDREAFNAEARTPHVYQVLNAEAGALAEIIGAVIGGSDQSTATEPGDTGVDGDGQSGGVSSVGAITVDEQGNRLIFFGTQSEFEQVVMLARQLDTPVPEVMIEVTIAEVTLTDDSQVGLSAVFDSEVAPTFSALLRSNGGFTGVVETGQVTLSADASANNNQINILSTPRIVTRSGASASVQVGTDVPIITSQSAGGSQTGGSTDVLQTVQYRSTGVILNVEPRVYSGDRIDLQISQETSSAEANENAGIPSPVISTRSLTSELSLQDGQMAVLGGLIENRFTRGNSGIPLVKDIPVVGAAFRNETLTSTRTMLVVLVTPFVLDTRNDRQQVVDALVNALNDNYTNQLGRSGTLLPPREPMQIRPAGGVVEPAAE